ncbi:hypothetical protein ABPG74_008254 [Tetrahymena malaccensis]
MNNNRLLAFYSLLIYNLNSIFSMVVSILIYQEEHRGKNELAYFITFFVIFGLDKFSCLFRLFDPNDSKIQWILDIFSVGFIFIPFKMVNYSYLDCFLGRIFLQVLIELIFFFYVGIIRDNLVNNYLKICMMISYIFFLLNTIIIAITTEFQYQKNKFYLFKQIFFNLFPFYVSIATLSFYVDTSGTNLAIYHIFITMLISIGLSINVYLKTKIDLKYIVGDIVGLIFLNNFLSDVQMISIKKVYLEIYTYFGQLLRCLLIICFSYQEIFDYQEFNSNQVKFILTHLTILLTLMQLGFEFKKVFLLSFKTKIINIAKEEEIQLVNNILNQDNKMHILILLQLKKQTNQNKKEEQVLKQIKFKNEVLTLLKYVTQFENRLEITFEDTQSFFEYLEHFYEDIVVNLKEIQNQLLNKISESEQIKQKIFQLILERAYKGFIFTASSFQLIEKIKSSHLKNKLYENISLHLQITSFYKYVYHQMQYNPNNIIYDLYDNQ